MGMASEAGKDGSAAAPSCLFDLGGRYAPTRRRVPIMAAVVRQRPKFAARRARRSCRLWGRRRDGVAQKRKPLRSSSADLPCRLRIRVARRRHFRTAMRSAAWRISWGDRRYDTGGGRDSRKASTRDCMRRSARRSAMPRKTVARREASVWREHARALASRHRARQRAHAVQWTKRTAFAK